MKDREQYWRDMSNQKNRAYYIEKAREMNEGNMLCDSAFSSAASQRKRVRQPRDHSLEWAMSKSHRAAKNQENAWDPKECRALLRQRNAGRFWMELTARRKNLRQSRAEDRA